MTKENRMPIMRVSAHNTKKENELKTYTDKQMEIISSSIELIAEKGIQQLTIKNLSQKINKAEGAIYRHFNSKIEILLGILHLFRQNKDMVLTNLQLQNLSAPEKLQNLLSKRISYFAASPAIAAVIFSEEIFQNDKILADEVFQILEDSQKIMTAIIARGQADHQIREDIPAEQLTLLITGALRLLVTKWRLANFSFDLSAEGQKLRESVTTIITK